MSDIDFRVPWFAVPVILVLQWPFGLGWLGLSLVLVGLPAFVIAVLLAKPLIGVLRGAAARQTAYEDAPQTHRTKTGTPTMGGVLFGLAPLIALVLFPRRETLALAVLVYGCMAIGAWDDLMAIRQGKNRGLRALPKFALTAVVAVVFLAIAAPQATVLFGIGTVPAWFWYGLSVVVVLSTTHAVNLTDGLDGLAAGTIVPPLLVLTCASGAASAPFGVAAFSAATIGTVLGFLVYNRHPARVFMGDTGSLALGGALAGIAILTRTQLLLLLIGGVFAAETLSVIIQVASYKTTRRRVFRMSPLHHHFELGGWPETKVTSRFWLASLFLSLLGFALISRTAS
ncbi:MAG TPA: phospho-N-acetylmuramoyl-pentapeptide-transferase [Candidatus Elarobacter sp.]|jgi:phospho-N-acetylmuramoyl-pentapeptide-transferase